MATNMLFWTSFSPFAICVIGGKRCPLKARDFIRMTWRRPPLPATSFFLSTQPQELYFALCHLFFFLFLCSFLNRPSPSQFILQTATSPPPIQFVANPFTPHHFACINKKTPRILFLKYSTQSHELAIEPKHSQQHCCSGWSQPGMPFNFLQMHVLCYIFRHSDEMSTRHKSTMRADRWHRFLHYFGLHSRHWMSRRRSCRKCMDVSPHQRIFWATSWR